MLAYYVFSINWSNNDDISYKQPQNKLGETDWFHPEILQFTFYMLCSALHT